MAKSLNITLMGSPEIQVNGQVVTLPTRKAFALLVYVLLEQKSHSREHLMTLFWADSDLKRAQTSLRTTLGYIRKYLPDAPLIIDHNVVMFQSDENIEIDVLQLQAAVALARRLPLSQSALIPVLQEVANLIRGDFLTGFSLSDSIAFDDWLITRREGFHQQSVQLLEILSRLQLEAGLINDGLQTTTHWLRIDALDERAYQTQMQLHLANGNRVAALQTYKSCSLMLANEFGIQPATRTNELAKQAQTASDASHKMLDMEAECIALNRMATTIAQSTYNIEAALDLLRQALYFAKQLDNPLHLAETTLNLAQSYFYIGQLETAETHANTAVMSAREIHRDDLLGRALNSLAYINLWKGENVHKTIGFTEEAILLFKQLVQPTLVADVLTVQANAYLCSGYTEAGLKDATEALQLSIDIQNDWGFASAAYNLGLAYLDTGDIQQAVSICERGLAKARIAGHPPLIFFNMLVLGHVRRVEGGVNTALELHQQCLLIGEKLKSPFFKLLVSGELCADYAHLQAWTEAAEFALEAQSLRERVPYPDFTRWYEIEALLKNGNTALVVNELNKLSAQVRHNPTNRRCDLFLKLAHVVYAKSQQLFDEMELQLQAAKQLAQVYSFATEVGKLEKLLLVDSKPST